MNETLENGTSSSIPFVSSERDTYRALQTAINSINLILGLPVNGYVLWLILSGAGGTIASEFFYLSLTLSVIFYSLLAAVFFFAWIFTRNYIFAMVCSYVYVAFFAFSVPWFQCCICVERYIAVVHPVVFLRYKALRYRVACSCVVWLTSLAVSLFVVWLETVLSYVFLGFYMACIAVVSFCCFSVLRALKKPGPGEGQRDSGEGNDMKGRAFKIILISLIIMLLTTMSYIPYELYYLLSYSSTVFGCVTFAIGTMSAFAHPLLYIYKAGRLPCFKRF